MTAVVIEQTDGVAVLRMNEPDSMNAMSATLKDALAPAVESAVHDPAVRCILLTGTGNAFCAGGDIRSFRPGLSPHAMRGFMRDAHRWCALLITCEKPVVTAVNGAAAGAGFGLAMMGDVIFASDDAVFKCGFSGLGAVPDFALAYTLPRAIGFPRAKEIIFSNRTVRAEEAERIGMVSRVVPRSALMEEALATARRLAAGPTLALGMAKTLINEGYDETLEKFLMAEASAQGIAFNTEDLAEGVAAFREKRVARFQAR